MFLQGSMTCTDTGPMSRCTLLMSFLHPVDTGGRRRSSLVLYRSASFVPSPSSLCLAKRNVRNSSDCYLNLVHSEDNKQVLNEVVLTFGTLICCVLQVGTFLEANDSGLSEADKEVAKDAYIFFIGPLFPQRHHDPALTPDLLNVKPR